MVVASLPSSGNSRNRPSFSMLRTFWRTSKQIGVPREKRRELAARVASEFDRLVLRLVAVLVVVAWLPELRERYRRQFQRLGLSAFDREFRRNPEDLAQQAVVKIMSTLFGAWPTGNVGAWLSTIPENLWKDSLRSLSRRPSGGSLTTAKVDAARASTHERQFEAELLDAFNRDQLAVIQGILAGESLEQIAANLNRSPDEVREIIHSVMDYLSRGD